MTMLTNSDEDFLLYQRIIKDSNTAVFVAKKNDGTIIFANDAWKRLCSIDVNENVTGKKLHELMPAEELFLSNQEIDNLFTHEYAHFYRVKPDGLCLHVWAKGLIWQRKKAYICYIHEDAVSNMEMVNQTEDESDEQPRIGTDIVDIAKDITDIRRTKKIIKAIVQADYDVILTVNVENENVRKFASKIKVYKNDDENQNEFSKNDIKLNCVDEDVDRVVKENSLEYVKERLESSSVYYTTFTIKLNNQVQHKRAMYAYLDKTRKEILCAVQDVSETYELEENQRKKLQEALIEAETANAAKTEFFSRMSHDMRTPMNGILGIAELSKNEMNIDVMRENFAKISEAGEYLLGLINDTLDFQKIECGKLVLEPQVIHTKVLLNNITDMIQETTKRKNIDFRVVNVNANLDQYIRVDPVRIKQIFINLLSNAAKFTPQGGMITLEISCLERDARVSHNLIRISDTGIGMSKEFMESGIFDPFAQEFNEVTSQYAGTGLGLSIVHKLVELMDGRIEVESELGVGTTFSVYIDFERIDENEIKLEYIADEQHQVAMMAKLNGKHILLTEDHPLNAEIATRLLKKVGISVVWVKNGQEAVDLFNNSKPGEFDVILMDIRMPVLNGLEATGKIRNLARPDAKHIPIIAMTANAYEEDIKHSLEVGMNDHLAKPIDSERMYETIAKWIDHTQGQQMN